MIQQAGNDKQFASASLIRRSLTVAAGSAGKFAVQLLIFILYGRILSAEDYGRYQSVWLFINFFSVVCLFGLPVLLLTVPFSEIKFWIRRYAKSVLLIATFFHLTAAGYILFFAGSFAAETKCAIILLLLLQNGAFVFESIAIRAEKEFKLLTANIIYILLYAAAHCYVIFTGYSLNVLLVLLCIISAIKCILLGNIAFNSEDISVNEKIGRLWLMIGLNDVLGVTVKWADKWLVLWLLPVTQFAVYFNGTYEIPLFMILLSSVGNVGLVEASKPGAMHLENIIRIFHKSSRFLTAIMVPAGCFLFFYANELFHTAFAGKYDASALIFQISILVLPVRTVYSTTVLQAFNRSEYIVRGAVIDLVAAALLCCILYPLFGLPGLALAFVISTWLQVIYYLYYSAKIMKTNISSLLPLRYMSFILIISIVMIGSLKYLTAGFEIISRQVFGLIMTGILTAIFLFRPRE